MKTLLIVASLVYVGLTIGSWLPFLLRLLS